MLRRLESTLSKWLVVPTSGVHLDVADGFRGLAIVGVVISHAFYANPKGPALFIILQRICSIGGFGVPIFFALSGFLLSIPFFRGRQQNPRFWYCHGFATRRILKIVPPFYLTIVVLVLVKYFYSHDPDYFKLGFVWATGIAHFVPYPPLNGTFWSLWVEIGFYAVLPFLFLAVPGRDTRKTGWILFLLLLATGIVSRLLFWQGANDAREWHFVTNRFPAGLDAFGWGILFASIYLPKAEELPRWRSLARFGYLGTGILLFAVLLFCLAPPYLHLAHNPMTRWEVEQRQLLPGIGAFFMFFFIFDPNCLASRFFSSSPMRFLGIISYEWFLFHLPFLEFRLWVNGSHGSLARYAVVVGAPVLISLGLSILVYHNFSLPIMKWGRGKLR